MHPLWEKSKKLNPVKAEVAQLVERNLAKVKVAGSRPVFRSKIARFGLFFCPAWVVELVDTQDLKSCVSEKQTGAKTFFKNNIFVQICLGGGIGRHAGLNV